MSVRVAGPMRFEVESLEERRLLSGSGTSSDPIPLDVAHEARVSGTFPASQTQWFSFAAQKGTPYLLTFPAYHYLDSFDVYSENQSQIEASGTLMQPDRIEWTAPRAGTFFIRLHREDIAGGSDMYSLNARIHQDDYGNSAELAAAFPASGKLEAHMEGGNDSDWFSFKSDTRHTYTFTASSEEFDSVLVDVFRSEEHTSELQSQSNLVCRLLLE